MAAEQGDGGAQYNLAEIYYIGKDVPNNYRLAFRWYLKASTSTFNDDTNAMAFQNLGNMSEGGEGTIKDYVRAHMWYNIGAMYSGGVNETLRELLEEQMTSLQIQEAQKLARECVAKDYKDC